MGERVAWHEVPMLPPNPTRVGGEIDAFCNKCELNLAHTIIAMVGPKVVKVQCNTCDSVHQYRGEQPLVKAQSFANPRRASATPRAPRVPATIVTWDQQLKGKDLSRARKYSVRDTYAVDEVVDHPTFGLGLVTAVRLDKVDIAFKGLDKTLVHGKGGGGEAKPHFQPPKPSGGLSDKPPGEGAAPPPPAPAPSAPEPLPSAPDAGGGEPAD